MNHRLIDWKKAAELARECQARGGTVVTTNGSFDLIHKGHVSYLEKAREMGDILIVGINSDSSVKRYKGPERPLNTQDDRAFVLSGLRCINAVCVFDEDTPVEWLNEIKPNIHVKGGDWSGKKIPEEDVMEKLGGKVLFIPFVDGYSTTSLIQKSQGKK